MDGDNGQEPELSLRKPSSKPAIVVAGGCMHFFASLRALSESPFQILSILCIHVPFPIPNSLLSLPLPLCAFVPLCLSPPNS